MAADVKLSYIVTFYNLKEYVKDCIDSILNQVDTPAFEILVGDDGSTDGTLEILQEYEERFPETIHLYCMPRHSDDKTSGWERMLRNRLNLLRHAQGQYLNVIDGDDYLNNPKFAKKGVDFLESHSTYIGCMFKWQRLDSCMNLSVPMPKKLHEGEIDPEIYLSSFYIHVGACIFRNVFSKERIDILEEKRTFEDTLIVSLLMNRGALWHIEEPSYVYRIRSSSLFSSLSKYESTIDNLSFLPLWQYCCPKYQPATIMRLRSSMKYAWANKAKISNPSSSLIQRVNLRAELYTDNFASNILNWKTISNSQKKETTLIYWKYGYIAFMTSIRVKFRKIINRVLAS